MSFDLQVFSGNANPALAREIASYLGIPLGDALIGTFKNLETRVRIERNVRGADVFVIQPTCHPVNENLMELFIILDALRRASAGRVTAVIPYYGYAKQEKKTTGREPISAKLVANLLTTAGANRILALDLHTPAIEGFFDIPVDHLRAAPVLATHCRELGLENVVIVSPDAGGVARAADFAGKVGGSLAIIAKQRPQPDVSEMVEMVGEVRGKTAVLVDDLISTGGTITSAANMLMDRGALDVYCFAVHAPMAPGGEELLRASVIKQVVVTNTIPLTREHKDDRLEMLTVAPLLAEAIKRIHDDVSVSPLFA
ncbi:MAG: ribose-phosphate pyrophosphokinase [Chloroflexota bacterium]